MKKECHFIYKTTNLINNKIYIGLHSTTNLDDGYLGSGKYLQRAIKKHGKQNFTREILEYCDTRDDLLQCEIKWIKELKSMYPTGYNLREDVGQIAGNFGGTFKMPEEAKKKISKANKGRIFTEEHKRNLSDAHKGYVHTEEQNLTTISQVLFYIFVVKERYKC